MPKKHRQSKQQGKQYDHAHLMHGKNKTMHGGLDRHDGDGDHYKHPHERDFSDGSHGGSMEYEKE